MIYHIYKTESDSTPVVFIVSESALDLELVCTFETDSSENLFEKSSNELIAHGIDVPKGSNISLE